MKARFITCLYACIIQISVIHSRQVSLTFRPFQWLRRVVGRQAIQHTSSKPAFENSGGNIVDIGPEALKYYDPEIYKLIEKERARQLDGINLIASENFVSNAVLEALGSCLTNKYSEGTVGKRYYSGTEHIDSIEELCQQRALQLFRLDSREWSVNVQPYSGSPANFAVYAALLKPGDTLLALDVPSGGHLSHGYHTASRNISVASSFYNCLSYGIDPITGLIDYTQLEEVAEKSHPKLIIFGASAYPRDVHCLRIKKIAGKCGAILMGDISHTAGLLAASLNSVSSSNVNDIKELNPFNYCDVVTTTCHKTLRGPRSALIFTRKSTVNHRLIDAAVFPGLQGGPHNNQIAAVAVALKEASAPDFAIYASKVKSNARNLAKSLIRRGYNIATNGTDNHIILWDLTQINGNQRSDLTGDKFQIILEMCGIYANKNMIVSKPQERNFQIKSNQESCRNAVSPRGIRLGTAALTTRFETLSINDIEFIATLLHQAVQLAENICASTRNRSLKEFLEHARLHERSIQIIRSDVKRFVRRYPAPKARHGHIF